MLCHAMTGYPNLSPEVEEGICQVLAHLWLESEMYSGPGNDVPSSSSSSASSSQPGSTSSKKGKRSDCEKKLGEFFKHQIESDSSSAYGVGFRKGNQAVSEYGLKRTLDHIKMTGSFPLWFSIETLRHIYIYTLNIWLGLKMHCGKKIKWKERYITPKNKIKKFKDGNGWFNMNPSDISS